MTFPARETIQHRTSVRSFDGRPLKDADRAALEHYLATVSNPFGVAVEFRLLDTKTHGVSSPVVTGADTYIAAKVERSKNFEIAYGYSFESVCLFAKSLGLGTVLLAASLSRSAFEKAMEVTETQVMCAASPVGYPAQKRSMRDSLMRKALKSDERIAFDQLFFDGTYGVGLTKEDAGVFADALEMARWAPSATNKQPWRAVVDHNTVHFFEDKTIKDSALGDVQKVDVGIALAHFDLTLQEDGISGRFLDADPMLTVPDNVHYLISYERA